MSEDETQATLYTHITHPHVPIHVGLLHKAMLAEAGINKRLAVLLTRSVGTMWAAYIFAVLAFSGLAGILGFLTPLTVILVAWTSQTLIQLCMLPIIMVGQSVLGEHQALQSDEMYQTSVHSFSDIEQIMNHLNAQDEKLLELEQEILALLKSPATKRGGAK